MADRLRDQNAQRRFRAQHGGPDPDRHVCHNVGLNVIAAAADNVPGPRVTSVDRANANQMAQMAMRHASGNLGAEKRAENRVVGVLQGQSPDSRPMGQKTRAHVERMHRNADLQRSPVARRVKAACAQVADAAPKRGPGRPRKRRK